MPNYTYHNKVTGEEITVHMTMAEHEHYLDDKPDWSQVIKSATVVDPVGIGVSKPPSDFQRHVLGRIKEAVPGATAIANRRWNIPREI